MKSLLQAHLCFHITAVVVAVVLSLFGTATPSLAWNVANTPPMGWNSWNLYACRVNATILMAAADAMVSSGLHKAGYHFVNSDDCWALSERNSKSQQVADPKKFPNGFKAVADHTHSLGLKQGIYTAKGNWTCQHRAGSCLHEAIDSKQYAEWGIDYVKDDACSPCWLYSADHLYHAMWEGISKSGRPMVLTVESDPVDNIITKGGYGNGKRVGHDIKPWMQSMITLIDIGSGLWPFAHNGSSTPFNGGWWNDLDMLEIGNGPDFHCSRDADALARCRYHFTFWTAMKAILLLGNDLATIDNITKSVVVNKAAISVNQDPLGVQGKRVRVAMPKNTTLVPNRNFAVIRKCDASSPTQKWRFVTFSDSSEHLVVSQSRRRHHAEKKATTANEQQKRCNSNRRSMTADQDDDEEIKSRHVHTASLPSGMLQVTAADGTTHYCLTTAPSGFYQVMPCPQTEKEAHEGHFLYQLEKFLSPGEKCESFKDICSFGVGWNTQEGASGPWPHSRYLNGGNAFWAHLSGDFNIDIANVVVRRGAGADGGRIVATDTWNIINDNLVGNVTKGGQFCLDAVPLGVLEVWATPMVDGKIAVVLGNRSPGSDSITFDWKSIGAASADAVYSVYDVWAEAPATFHFKGEHTVTVNAFEAAYFILTPS